jgi:hypothetical protein
LDKLYPDNSSSNKSSDGINYWKGKRIISADQWLKIKQDYAFETALRYFPDDFLSIVFPFNMDRIDDPKVREDTDKWYSDFKDLMEYKRNPTYGNTICFNCLLSPHREEAAIYLGINKAIARALERKHDDNNNITSSPTSTYPCSVLNIFECPYKRNDKEDGGQKKKN